MFQYVYIFMLVWWNHSKIYIWLYIEWLQFKGPLGFQYAHNVLLMKGEPIFLLKGPCFHTLYV